MDFAILGQLEAREQGRNLALGGSRQRAVLGVLLLYANDVVSSDQLVEAVWGEQPPASASKTIQGYVWALRKLLGASAIVTRPGGYSMQVADADIDLLRFRRLIHDADSRDTSAAAELLADALALWRGRVLTDLTLHGEPANEIRRLNGLRVIAQTDLIEAELELGRAARRIGDLEDLVAANPFDERLRRLLILALYRAGRQADALKAYAETRKMFVDELGIEPGAELKQLERAILIQHPALDSPTTPSAPAEVDVPAEVDTSTLQAAPDASAPALRSAAPARTPHWAQVVKDALLVSVKRPVDIGIVALGVLLGFAVSGWAVIVAALLYGWRLGMTIRATRNWHSLHWVAVRARSLVRIAPDDELRSQVRQLVAVCIEASRTAEAAARPADRPDRRSLRRLLEQSRDQYNLTRADKLERQITALDRLDAERRHLQEESDRLDVRLERIRQGLFRARVGAYGDELPVTLRESTERIQAACASLRAALDAAGVQSFSSG